jgi:NTP pyrophosphatase (non-canonical NTP hydrolase)
MQKLIQNVQAWANERGLNKPEQIRNQFLKIMSEYGETCDAIIKREKNGDADIIDGFGDIIVTLIVLANMRSLRLESVYYNALNIKGANEMYFGAFTRHLNHLSYAVAFEGDTGLEHAIECAVEDLYSYIADAGFTPEQCLAAAYSEIKDRKGVTVNGTFIKDEAQVADGTKNEVDLSLLEVGDSVEWRNGKTYEVIELCDRQGVHIFYRYSLGIDNDTMSYQSNGRYIGDLDTDISNYDIVAIHKA